MQDQKNVELRVSSHSATKSLAGCLASTLQEDGVESVTLIAIGAGAANQSVKAIAVARKHIAGIGRDLITRMGFRDIKEDDREISAILMVCEVK